MFVLLYVHFADDGKISRAEFAVAFTNKLGGSSEQAEKVFSKLDSKSTGEITVEQTSTLFWSMDLNSK